MAAPIVLAALASAIPAVANAGEGWYGRLGAGTGLDGEASISAGAPLGGDASLEDMSLVELGIGYGRADGWRAEVKLTRWDAGIEAGPLLDPGGSAEISTLMFSVYRDFGDGAFKPYVGAGVGVSNLELAASYTPPLSPVAVDADATTFSYEVGLGVGIEVAPRLALDLGYRYLTAIGYEATGAAPPSTAIPVDADISMHTLVVGLRWTF